MNLPWMAVVLRSNKFAPANLQPKNEQGCTFLGGDVRGSTQLRRFCLAKTRVQKLTRRSIFELVMDGGGVKRQ